MTHSARIVRWESTSDASRCGIEISGLDLTGSLLEAELDRLHGRIVEAGPAFVVVGFAASEPFDLSDAISRLSLFSSNTHLCVALDHPALLALDPALLRAKKVGVLLDGVGADTPLGAVSARFVEGIRFDARFVERAASDLRLSCVVDAMLKAARDLGVATLGSVPNLQPRQRVDFDFDYVPSRGVRPGPQAISALTASGNATDLSSR